MHRIKRQAKRDAWYNDDGQTNFNPFGKLWRPDTRDSRAPKSVGNEDDLEAGVSGLNRRQTEGDTGLMSSPEAAHQKENWGDVDVIQAQTEPPLASRKRSSGSDRGISTEKETAIESQAGEASSGQESEPIATGKRDMDEGEVRNRDPHHRKMGGLLGKLGKHHDETDEKDDKKKEQPKQHFTVWSQIQNTIFNSPINILLPLVPAGIVLGFAFEDKVPAAAVFTINFIAIIPLAGLLSYATEELAIRVGETLGGLLNASFGNAVELIVSIIALFNNQYVIVQTSLVGSMLSNLLLVMGMCFFFGGRNKVEQHFNVTVAQTAASLLALAIGSLIIPTVWNEIVGTPATGDTNVNDNSDAIDKIDKPGHVAALSRGVSVLLLLTYGAYLYFQLSTHAAMYNAPSKKAERRKPKKPEKGDALKAMMKPGHDAAKQGAGEDHQDEMDHAMEEEDDDEEEVPKLSLIVAILTLCISTVLVALCAEPMTKAINEIATPESHISQEFVGLILLPIVGNAAEHATAVTVAIKDKMDLAIGVAVGSSMQIALLIIPLVVVIGWCADKEKMTLAFDGFQVIVLFVAVLLVNYLIGDGKSHWLEGVLLMMLYIIIAVAAFYYPTQDAAAG